MKAVFRSNDIVLYPADKCLIMKAVVRSSHILMNSADFGRKEIRLMKAVVRWTKISWKLADLWCKKPHQSWKRFSANPLM